MAGFGRPAGPGVTHEDSGPARPPLESPWGPLAPRPPSVAQIERISPLPNLGSAITFTKVNLP